MYTNKFYGFLILFKLRKDTCKTKIDYTTRSNMWLHMKSKNVDNMITIIITISLVLAIIWDIDFRLASELLVCQCGRTTKHAEYHYLDNLVHFQYSILYIYIYLYYDIYINFGIYFIINHGVALLVRYVIAVSQQISNWIYFIW